jgi:hypothetical protein
LLTREQKQALLEVLTKEVVDSLEKDLQARVLLEASRSGLASEEAVVLAIEALRGIENVCGYLRQLESFEPGGSDAPEAERRRH